MSLISEWKTSEVDWNVKCLSHCMLDTQGLNLSQFAWSLIIIISDYKLKLIVAHMLSINSQGTLLNCTNIDD